MSKLLILKGLPASGKSTFARKLVSGDIRNMPGPWVRVNKDDLRAMLHNSKHSKSNEGFVIQVRDFIVGESLYKGQSVVVDDTNFSPVHVETLTKIGQKYGATVEVQFIDTPIELCIQRDLERSKSVGEGVIRKMYNEYLKPAVAPPVVDSRLPWAIICDIDGTLAHMQGRSPFEWARVGEDQLDFAVSHIASTYPAAAGVQLIMVSGRDEVCRPETVAWLKQHEIKYDWLFMRPKDDMRKDTIVKAEIYEELIAGQFNIDFVLDDRDQVVEMWRSKGLKCLQVAEGAF